MAPSQAARKLSEFQLQIMNVVWDRGEVSVADVQDALAGRRRVVRSTIQTMLARLEQKGWLRHREDGQAFRYSATLGRAEVLGRLVDRLVETAFGGSAEGLVLALVDGRGVTESEAARIHELIRAAAAASEAEGAA